MVIEFDDGNAYKKSTGYEIEEKEDEIHYIKDY